MRVVKLTRGMVTDAQRVMINSGSEGAWISGNTLTINRAAGGFGTKSTPAPHRFFPLQSDANGTDARYIAGLTATGSTIGMEQYNLDYGDRWTYVQAGENPWGKDLVISMNIVGTSEGFTPAMGSLMPTNTHLVRGSMWMKITRAKTTALGQRSQWKAPRTGIGTSSNGNVNYQAVGLKFHGEIWSATGTSEDFDSLDPMWNDTNGTSHEYGNELSPSSGIGGLRAGAKFYDQWHCWQWLISSGTLGVADGFFYIWCDGGLVIKKTNLAVRLGSSTAYISSAQFVTGLQLIDTDTYSIRCSRPCIDNSQARVELINAATYAAATGFLSMRPTSWTDSGIVVQDVYIADIPAVRALGYNWVAVTNSAGTTTVIGLT